MCLPHWTVTEFLEQLEFFLNGSFHIDAKAKKISFRFHTNMLSEQQTYIINKVVDEHQVEISDRENVQESYVHIPEHTRSAFRGCSQQSEVQK